MRFHMPISFDVTGTPKRHRTEKTTTYFEWIPVEIPIVDPIDAPVALRIHNADDRLEAVRVIDGEFYYPSHKYKPVTRVSLETICENHAVVDTIAKVFAGGELMDAIHCGDIEEFNPEIFPGPTKTNRDDKIRDLQSRMARMTFIDGMVWEKRTSPVIIYHTHGFQVGGRSGRELQIVEETNILANSKDHVFNPTATRDDIVETLTLFGFEDINEMPEAPEAVIPEVLDYDVEEREFLNKISAKNIAIWERAVSLSFYDRLRGYNIVSAPQLIAVLQLRDLLENKNEPDNPVEEIEEVVEQLVGSASEYDKQGVELLIDDMRNSLERWRNRDIKADYDLRVGMAI